MNNGLNSVCAFFVIMCFYHILAQCFVCILYYPAPEHSPRIGASRVAQVLIEKNDNASGVVQLSSSAVSVHEPHSGSVVNVTRTAGDFGTVSEAERMKAIPSMFIASKYSDNK